MCRRIAEAGGTAHEIMSVSGHLSLAEAQRYCSKFGRASLADAAFEKLDESLNRAENLANHSERFAKNSDNELKKLIKNNVLVGPEGLEPPTKAL